MSRPSWRTRLSAALSTAVQQIVEGYQPERIVVFGSAARGDVHEDSDIDLLIIKRTDRRFLERIGDVLDVLDVDVPVEPIVYTPEEVERMMREGRDFILTVLQEGRTVYERR